MKKTIERTFNLNSSDFSGNWLEKDFIDFTNRADGIFKRIDCPDCRRPFVMSQSGLLVKKVNKFSCPYCGRDWEINISDAKKIRRRLEEYLRRNIGDAIALAAAVGCKLTD